VVLDDDPVRIVTESLFERSEIVDRSEDTTDGTGFLDIVVGVTRY
jgi:hypothetical protein